jgi:hypothetical protein
MHCEFLISPDLFVYRQLLREYWTMRTHNVSLMLGHLSVLSSWNLLVSVYTARSYHRPMTSVKAMPTTPSCNVVSHIFIPGISKPLTIAGIINKSSRPDLFPDVV